MACIQRVRTLQDVQLLPNQVVTEQQSLVVIKKLLAIGVSGITYLRGLFPEKAYGSKYVEDQKVMILRDERSCPGAKQIVQWIQGCFEAIEKKYLRVVIMSIYTDPDEPQKVTEVYRFRIYYTTRGAQMEVESNNNKLSCESFGSSKKASILLVRKLYTLIQHLGPLPDIVCLNMKLAFYEDVTPQDYQPPGFKEAEVEFIEFDKESVKLFMGEVTTPFHTLKLDMATERHRVEQVEESVAVKEKWVLNIGKDSVFSQSHIIQDAEEPDNDNTNLNNTGIQTSCCEKETSSQINAAVNKTSDMKRTRGGRVIKSTTKTNLTVSNVTPAANTNKAISQFAIPSSQDTPSSTAPKKKRKFSEPKDPY